jgi:5'-nucleotidase
MWLKNWILSPNKALLKGDFLIDDMINGKGQEDFEGELITFGSEKYPNWKSVIKKLAP